MRGVRYKFTRPRALNLHLQSPHLFCTHTALSPCRSRSPTPAVDPPQPRALRTKPTRQHQLLPRSYGAYSSQPGWPRLGGAWPGWWRRQRISSTVRTLAQMRPSCAQSSIETSSAWGWNAKNRQLGRAGPPHCSHPVGAEQLSGSPRAERSQKPEEPTPGGQGGELDRAPHGTCNKRAAPARARALLRAAVADRWRGRARPCSTAETGRPAVPVGGASAGRRPRAAAPRTHTPRAVAAPGCWRRQASSRGIRCR